MAKAAVSIGDNGQMRIIIYADTGDPLFDCELEAWDKLVKESYKVIHKAYKERDKLRGEGKLDADPFFLYLGEDNPYHEGNL